jgi:putative ABC transport system permease protein
MLAPRWKKVLRDVASDRTRTAVVVLLIAVGVAAFTLIMAARANITRLVHDSFVGARPVSATLSAEPFDDDLIAAVRRIPAVGSADGQRTVAARLALEPGRWIDLTLHVVPDDGALALQTVRPEEGAWPPPRHALVLERSSLSYIRTQVGAPLVVELGGGRQRPMAIAGSVYDASRAPALLEGGARGYITFQTLTWLGGPASSEQRYNQLAFTVAERPVDVAHIRAVAAQVARQVEDSGRTVQTIDVPVPLQHPAESVLPVMMTILTGIGVGVLLLSALLIVNTIEAILAQQMRQIGVLKAIGATTRTILTMYVGLVLFFGALALLIAAPLGALGGFGLTFALGTMLNLDAGQFQMPRALLALAVGAALASPVLAAIAAIRRASRITVRDAIATGGAGEAPGTRPVDRALQRVGGLPRLVLLVLRNTFRRAGRLARTLAVLTLSGVLFITVLTLNASLNTTLGATLDAKRYDLEVQLARPYHAASIVSRLEGVPGVVYAEGLGFARAYPLGTGGRADEALLLYAPPPDTQLIRLPLKEGRWLRPDDTNAIVLSANYLAKRPETRVGDSLTLDIPRAAAGADSAVASWTIVGIVSEFKPPVGPAVGYVPYAQFVRAAGGIGKVSTVRLVTEEHDTAAHARLVEAINAYGDRLNLSITSVSSLSEERADLTFRFAIITTLLLLMAALLGAVGGLGLMGALSLNVMERTREIGVLRAVGATNRVLYLLVTGEGLLIALIAWLLAGLLALPLSRAATFRFGMQLFAEPLLHRDAFYAFGLWLAIVAGLSVMSSYLPARNAARLTIREVLAYE